MNEKRVYEVEGMVMEIPIHYDEKSGIFIEDYPDFIENPVWTPKGHRVLFTGTDACPAAEEDSPGGCLDCGSCRYFKRAADHTWFGMCANKHSPLNRERRNKDRKNE